MARRWAWFVRNVQSLERVSPELEALGGYLRARGLSGEDFRVAASCLLEATRRTAGGAGIGWNGELEADWAAAIERVTGLMNPARRLALPMAA
jgi:hypothetical protein